MFPQRLEERRVWLRNGFSQSVRYAIDQRAHLFLQVGDLFDIPEPRNAERQFGAEALADLRAAGVRCLGIGGNHDTPRIRSAGAPATPQGTYARLGGLRLLGDPAAGVGDWASGRGDIDSEIFEIDGTRVAIGGITPDPTAAPGSDPLEGVEWRPDADVTLLLIHGSLQGHVFPGAPEPVIRRETVERLGLNLLLVGHVHKFATFRWGATTVVVPGATEHLTFGELESRPGFVYLELEPGRIPEVRHVPVEPQPRLQLTILSSELATGDPAERAKERLEVLGDRETMVRVSFEGPISRQRYHDLRLRELAEFGAARCFYLDLNTTGLYVEDDLPRMAARSGRLSPREELLRYGEEVRDAAATAEERVLVEEAIQAILSEYE
jgi:DNA repair exonuclease SbcCD nuclease subunit